MHDGIVGISNLGLAFKKHMGCAVGMRRTMRCSFCKAVNWLSLEFVPLASLMLHPFPASCSLGTRYNDLIYFNFTSTLQVLTQHLFWEHLHFKRGLQRERSYLNHSELEEEVFFQISTCLEEALSVAHHLVLHILVVLVMEGSAVSPDLISRQTGSMLCPDLNAARLVASLRSSPLQFTGTGFASLALLHRGDRCVLGVASSTCSPADVNVLLAAATGISDSHRLK